MRLVRRTRRLMLSAAFGVAGVGLVAGPAAANAGGPLPDTGSSPLPWIIGAIVVLGLGGGLYALSRRK
ncbi:LPXTG cell wall anchor domain-containing protein [Phytoactinopolyspora sp. XMNu-373]|uniref:LPXTG cell wall anchor domain-containing protein n=2 Tax=Phytoactinopolyspora mesophila TaxID=2650750 RepID=A0A7K3MBV5_9ACTN|nr:LPXTG cell wall anchor domain-containing protein [Phytoactinopolyspora mesophila]